MKDFDNKEKHESFGMISISRFSSNGAEFFGSDLIHNGGITIEISQGSRRRGLHSDWFSHEKHVVTVDLSNSQYIDAITSGMNTNGVPCTIKRINGKILDQVQHVNDKKDQFSTEMEETQAKFIERINDILAKMDGNIGQKKSNEIKHDLEVLKNHISSNTKFVLTCFDEAMEKTVTEAKHSIANYIDHKVNSMGIEALKEEVQLKIEPPKNTK